MTRQAAYDVSDPTRAEVSFDGLVKVTRGCETDRARSVHERPRHQPGWPSWPSRPGFAWHGLPASGKIDELVFAKLKAMRKNPSGIGSDHVFLRRAFLDAIGRLPEPDEARSFLEDRDPQKRSKLVDRLLDRPEFADFWALEMGRLLRNEEKTMGQKGAWVFQRWLRDRIGRRCANG